MYEVSNNLGASSVYNTKEIHCENFWVMTNLIGMILGMHHNICGVSHNKKIPVFDPYNLFDLNNKCGSLVCIEMLALLI